jgi:MFS family permease
VLSGNGFGASVTGGGLFLLPTTVLMLISSPIAGRMAGRVGSRVPLILGAGFSALAFALLAVAHSSPWQVYLGAAIVGIGIGLAFASMANLIVEAVSPTQTGIATGMNTIARTVGGALGTTINTQVLNELPLIGRNPYVFLTLSPGIQYTGDPGALNPWDVSGVSAFAAAGSKAKSEFLLDGIPNMGISNVSLSPSPDAVQEMRVQTSAYDAEFGHSAAAFVNVSTRSGTNQYHGSV